MKAVGSASLIPQVHRRSTIDKVALAVSLHIVAEPHDHGVEPERIHGSERSGTRAS
jgi:hypothetical protein